MDESLNLESADATLLESAAVLLLERTAVDPLVPGSITSGPVTCNSVELYAGEASGGLPPYDYQWYCSETEGDLGYEESGQTSRFLCEVDLDPACAYYFTIRYQDSSDPPRTADSSSIAVQTLEAPEVTVQVHDQSLARIVATAKAGAPLPVDLKALDGSVPATQNARSDYLEPAIPVSAISADLIARLVSATVRALLTLTRVDPVAASVADRFPGAPLAQAKTVIDPASIVAAVAPAVFSLEQLLEALIPLIPTTTENASTSTAILGSVGLNTATVETATIHGFTATIRAPDGTILGAGSSGLVGMVAFPQSGRNFKRWIVQHSVFETTHTCVIDPLNPWPIDAIPPVGSLIILG